MFCQLTRPSQSVSRLDEEILILYAAIGGAHQAAVYSHRNHGPINSNSDRTQTLAWLVVILRFTPAARLSFFRTFLLRVMFIAAGTLVPAVLTATSQSNGNGQTSTPDRIQTPLNRLR